jgi:hypothetical protein
MAVITTCHPRSRHNLGKDHFLSYILLDRCDLSRFFMRIALRLVRACLICDSNLGDPAQQPEL